MWENINVSLATEQQLDTIFAAVLLGGIDRTKEENIKLMTDKTSVAKFSLPKFLSTFQFNVFFNSYAIFYDIIASLNIKIFDKNALEQIIDANRDLVLNSPYVDKSRYGVTTSGTVANDDDIIVAVTEDLKDKLDELSNRYVSQEEFSSACIMYVQWYQDTLAEVTALNMTAIMSSVGLDVKKPNKRVRHYQGKDDMKEYYNENMRIIQSLSEEGRITSKLIDRKWLENELNNDTKKDDKSMCTIGLKEIDDVMGNLRRGHMLGIMGPPKGGKTRFTNYLVQRLLSFGYNVAVWPLEGSADEWEANQTACLIAQQSYAEALRIGKMEQMIRISSKDIIERKYLKSPEITKQVNSAKTIMATSPKYGRLSFIEGVGYVEDFLDVLESHYQNDNQFDVIVIDQLVNIASRTGKGKVERISDAYMRLHIFLEHGLKVPALGIMPCQLKQDVVDILRRNPDETIDVTAGGESAETVRTPDDVIGLFSSKEERDNNIMKIYSVASRHNGSFKDFQAKCYLECCWFMSNEQ